MSASFRLLIPRPIYEAMLAHAQAELPAECCGQLAGMISNGLGQVTQHFLLVNALASPTEFESDSMSTFAAHKAMRASGTEVLAVYHSHPTSDPVPSDRDLQRNFSESVVNIIIGLRTAKAEVRAWWLNASGSCQAEWEIAEPL